MNIKWGVRNIIHLVLFGIYLIALLINLMFIPFDPRYLYTLLLVAVSAVFFFIVNSKIILFAGTHLGIDCFLVLAIIGLLIQ